MDTSMKDFPMFRWVSPGYWRCTTGRDLLELERIGHRWRIHPDSDFLRRQGWLNVDAPEWFDSPEEAAAFCLLNGLVETSNG